MNQAKPEEWMYQAVTKVSVLSSVIINIVEVDGFIIHGRQHKGRRNGKPTLTLPESKAMAWCKMGFV